MDRNRMKLTMLFAVVILVSAFSVNAKRPAYGAEQVINLKYASYYKADFGPAKPDVFWMEAVTKRTNGRVTFTTYWDGSMLKAVDLMPGVSRGLCDIAAGGATFYNPDSVPLLTIGNLPLISDKVDAIGLALGELAEKQAAVKEEIRRNNWKWLHALPVTTILGMKMPITKLEDLKGKKIRCGAGVVEAMKAVGAVPVAIPMPDVYEAMQRGVIDGYSAIPFSTVLAYKLWEVGPYIVDVGLGVYAYTNVVMNLDTWKKLPTDIQKVMEDASQEAVKSLAVVLMDDTKSKLPEMVKTGGKLIKLKADEKAKFRPYAEPIWDNWIQGVEKKGLPGKDVFKSYLAAVRNCESESKYKTEFDLYDEAFGK